MDLDLRHSFDAGERVRDSRSVGQHRALFLVTSASVECRTAVFGTSDQVKPNSATSSPMCRTRDGLLFLDFMLIHGVGWFIVPLDVPVGSLCQIASLTMMFSTGPSRFPEPTRRIRTRGRALTTFFSLSDQTTGGVGGAVHRTIVFLGASDFRPGGGYCVSSVTTRPKSSGRSKKRRQTPQVTTPGYERGTAQSLPSLPTFCVTSCKRPCRRPGFHSCRSKPEGLWWTSSPQRSPEARASLGAGSFLLCRHRGRRAFQNLQLSLARDCDCSEPIAEPGGTTGQLTSGLLERRQLGSRGSRRSPIRLVRNRLVLSHR